MNCEYGTSLKTNKKENEGKTNSCPPMLALSNRTIKIKHKNINQGELTISNDLSCEIREKDWHSFSGRGYL